MLRTVPNNDKHLINVIIVITATVINILILYPLGFKAPVISTKLAWLLINY